MKWLTKQTFFWDISLVHITNCWLDHLFIMLLHSSLVKLLMKVAMDFKGTPVHCRAPHIHTQCSQSEPSISPLTTSIFTDRHQRLFRLLLEEVSGSFSARFTVSVLTWHWETCTVYSTCLSATAFCIYLLGSFVNCIHCNMLFISLWLNITASKLNLTPGFCIQRIHQRMFANESKHTGHLYGVYFGECKWEASRDISVESGCTSVSYQ